MWTFPLSTCDVYNVYSSRTSRYYPTYINLAFSIYIYIYIYVNAHAYIHVMYIYIICILYKYIYMIISVAPWTQHACQLVRVQAHDGIPEGAGRHAELKVRTSATGYRVPCAVPGSELQ